MPASVRRRPALVAAPVALSLVLGLVPALAGAAPPAASTARPAPFTVATLDNGLTLLLSPSHAHPVIALSGFVTTGGRTEDEHFQGSLHTIEHLVFKGGTPNLAPTEFRKTMSLLGRESGGWTWDDEINFGFEVPEDAFDEALGTYREALLDLQFSPEWFEDEKRVVLQEMTRGREQPERILYEAWDATAFTEHPYGRPVIGSEKAIRDLDMEKTYEYYRQRFSPNHMILSIAGDFDPEAMVETVRAVWGAEPRVPESFELGIAEPDPRGPRRRVEFLPQASTSSLLVGCVTPGGLHEDAPALAMLAALLEDPSYGLPQYLVEQVKWVGDLDVEQYAMRDYGTLRVQARCDPEREAAVEAFVSDFLVDFDPTTVPAGVFEETRRRMLRDEAVRRDGAAGRAARLGFLASRHGIEGALSWESRLAALTAADVRGAQTRWISRRRLVTAVVHPESFDPRRAPVMAVEPGAPFAPPAPDLDVPGALRPAAGDALAWELADEADGVRLYRYANGLRLLVRPTDASPLLAVTGRILGGQWVEPEGLDGIGLFTAELGLRATRRWDREGFGRLLGALSVDASAHIGVGSRANTSMNVDYRDSAAHHLRGLAAQWPEMLAILKETLFFPAFDPDEIAKLRADLLDAVRTVPENQLEWTKQEFYRRAYAGHPYGRVTRGTEASLAAIGPERLAAFHAACWTPDRAVVAVVGDVDPDEVATWIATRWADLPANGAARPWSIDPSRTPLAWDPQPGRQTLELGRNYWTVNWGRPGATATDPARLASIVLGRMAGNDHFYRYVYGEGVSYRSWIKFWEHLGPGAWILENDVERDRFDEILAMFDEDLARYATDGFPVEEFLSARRRLANDAVLDAQDGAMLAWRLARAEGDGLGFRAVTGFVDSLATIGYDDVQALAREVFAPDGILRIDQK